MKWTRPQAGYVRKSTRKRNIIVGAIIEPALDQAMRVSVVATGIDQSTNRLLHAQSFAEPVLPPNVAPASLGRTAGSAVNTVEFRRLVAAGTEFDTSSSSAPHPFSEPTGRRQILGRGDALRSASNSTAVRQSCGRSVGVDETGTARGVEILNGGSREYPDTIKLAGIPRSDCFAGISVINGPRTGLRHCGDHFEISQTPVRIAVAKTPVESLVARSGSDPLA